MLPNLSNTLAILSLTFLRVMWEESNFLTAIDKQDLNNFSASPKSFLC